MLHENFKNCTVCNSHDIAYLQNFKTLHLMKCKKCCFVFDERIPSELELNEHYKVYAYSGLKAISNETIRSYNRLLDTFESYKGSGNILDIGCGQGDFLTVARERGWNVYGIEYSQAAVVLCRERGIVMHQGSLSHDIFDELTFDVITSFEVIEHINNPNTFMSVVKHKLKEEGLFYATTPNFNALLRFFEKDKFKMVCYPEHISFYTKKSIQYLGEIHNFKSIKIETTGLDIGRLLNVIKSKKHQSNLSDTSADAKIVNENMRQLAGSNFFMGYVKKIINGLLRFTGSGDTLKVFWTNK